MMRLEIKTTNDINREAAKLSAYYHQVKVINMNFLQVKKYHLLLKTE